MNLESSGILPSPRVEALPVYVPGRTIQSVRQEFGVAEVLKLASNENPLGPGSKARAALAKAAKDMHLYPDGICRDLLAELAKLWDWPAEGIAVGNGSDEIFVLLAQAFLDAGDKVLVSEHTFSEYGFSAQLVGASIVHVPMPDHLYDLNGFASRCEGARMLFVCNPNNPTGTSHGHDAIANFLARVPATTMVVLDEAYAEFVRADSVRIRELLGRHPNLVVTRTFSKLHGLGGARVGYAVARPDVISALRRVKTPFNVGGPAQAAAKAALADREHIQRTLRMNESGIRQIEIGLRSMGLHALPTQANFVFVPLAVEAAPVCQAMMRRGVIIRGLASFGYPKAVRLTVGTRAQNRRLLGALEESLKEAGGI